MLFFMLFKQFPVFNFGLDHFTSQPFIYKTGLYVCLVLIPIPAGAVGTLIVMLMFPTVSLHTAVHTVNEHG